MNFYFDSEAYFPAMAETSDDTTKKIGTSHVDTPQQLKNMVSSFGQTYGNDQSLRGVFSYDEYARTCFQLKHPKLKALQPPRGSPFEAQKAYTYFRLWIKDFVIENNILYRKGKQGLLRVATDSNAVGLILKVHENLLGAMARTTFSRLRYSHYGITREHVEWFIKQCPTCTRNLGNASALRPSNASALRPSNVLALSPQFIKSSRPLERVQIDVMDFTSLQSGDFKWILHVKDHFSKFSLLFPLRSKHASEIASHLDQFIRYYGAPEILQCGKGKEFKGAVVLLLQKRKIKLTNGRLRHSQLQGVVERGNYTVRKRLSKWMTLENRTDWPLALQIVERSINTTCCKGLPSNMTPHECLFAYGGYRPKEGDYCGVPTQGDVTHKALAMSPEEVDRACIEDLVTGECEAFKDIADFYDSMPSTDVAIFGRNEDGDKDGVEDGEDSSVSVEDDVAPVSPESTSSEGIMRTTEHAQPIPPAAEPVPPIVAAAKYVPSIVAAAEPVPSNLFAASSAVPRMDSANPPAGQTFFQDQSMFAFQQQQQHDSNWRTSFGSRESPVSERPHSQLPLPANQMFRAVLTAPHALYTTGIEPQYSQSHYQQNFELHSQPLFQASLPSFSSRDVPNVASLPTMPRTSPGQQVNELQTHVLARDMLPMSNSFLTPSSFQNHTPPVNAMPILQMVAPVHSSSSMSYAPPKTASLDCSSPKATDVAMIERHDFSLSLTTDQIQQMRDYKFKLIREAQAKGRETMLRVKRHQEKEAANRVLKNSRSVHHKTFDEGDIVTYLIPKRVRGPLDMPRAYVKILAVDSRPYPECKLQTEFGVLADRVPCSQLNPVTLIISDNWKIRLSSAPSNVISIHEFGGKQSFGGQRVASCRCKTGCRTMSCACKKAGVQCSQYCGHRGCANRNDD